MSRQKQVFYWTLYALIALFLLLLQSAVLNRVFVRSVHPFLLPCVVALTAIYTPRRGGVCFAFFLGLLCDLLFLGPIPCFYLLAFTACAFGTGLLSHRFIMPGFFCTLLLATVCFLFTELLQFFFLSLQTEVPFFRGMTLLLTELLITLPLLIPLHPIYARTDRFLSNL